ncbi:MAG: site-specific DNA-methyltransferase [Coleofasciculus sp. D1-CHI-01]|uniref:site-specific DNA-methyltransferase n=1 Tax=Coleofasciculus sp. D1-CHI-01 TaxID=3068482 RepID=UPI003304EFB7
MATGIPRKNRKKERNKKLAKDSNNNSISLEYEGKSPMADILATTPAKLNCVVEIPGQPINRLIYGDNLRVLYTLLNDQSLAGKVCLIYIDPPYATGSHFASRKQDHAYKDLLEGAEYLEFLRCRLILMRELLAEHGSIYVHLDENMAFHVKVLMDEIFGRKSFRNLITRKKCNPKNYTKKQYGNISDYILFYTKTNNYVWNQPFETWTEETSRKEYTYIEKETGRRYKKVPIHAPGVRNGETGKSWRGMMPPPGKHWQYTPKTLEQMDARGEIYWSPNGNPRRKVYLDESKGIPIQDIWFDFKDAHNQNIKITGYPTEKNPDLLKRIIMASSNPGDLILDAFAGSGTTPAVAEDLNREWIAIDNAPLAMETIVWRLAKGTEVMGDFLNGKGNKHSNQIPLLDLNRVLHSGLKIYIEEAPDLEMIPTVSFGKWYSLLNSLTMA